MVRIWLALVCVLGLSVSAVAQDLSAAFGARESISSASLSPDGTKIAFVGPGKGQSTVLYVFDASKDKEPQAVTSASGDPERILGCLWSSNDRLVCTIGGYQEYNGEIYGFSNVVALNLDGKNVKVLSNKRSDNALWADFRGGAVIDYLPAEDGAVLMARTYVPEAKAGSLIEKRDAGMGVDRVDTRNGSAKRVVAPQPDAIEYITDGRGDVRIVGTRAKGASGYDTGAIKYRYKVKGTNDWRDLGTYNYLTGEGFNPYAVDGASNSAFGFRKIDGRQAFVAVDLNQPGGAERLLYAHPQVDIDEVIMIGKQRRAVGVSYATDKRQAVFFDPEMKRLTAALSKAIPDQPSVVVLDASLDESKLLLWAGSDVAPGQIYLLDRTSKKLQPFMSARPQLAEVKLARVQPINYPASDGTMIPGYLTLPVGGSGKNLPAIVMPHGGPSARDEWGFDWLAQYYVSQGFAVLQPNYRGSSGYGDGWYQSNGFQSWKTAIGDINDAGRWLANQGIAARDKLYIVGWSYGGYAALQSAVLDPGLFKAIVAIAPVTDLAELKRESVGWSDRRVSESFIGSGPHIKEGSPLQNAERIQAPVMLFHGVLDRNVGVNHSRLMNARLKELGRNVQYFEYPKLEHSLIDSAVRAELLSKSAAFLKAR